MRSSPRILRTGAHCRSRVRLDTVSLLGGQRGTGAVVPGAFMCERDRRSQRCLSRRAQAAEGRRWIGIQAAVDGRLKDS